MSIFAIVGTEPGDHAAILQQAKSLYGDPNVYELRAGLFIAAPNGSTTQDIAVRLGIGDDRNNRRGIVILTNYYWGYHDKGLWEWMSARSSNG